MSEYLRKPIVKTLMLKGQDAVSISNIEKKSTSGLTDTYEITLTDGSKKTFNVSNGKGIKSISKTSTSGLIDTYTTTYNDDTTSTFTVKNGEKGDTGSVENLEVGGVNILLNSNFDGTSNPRENWIQWGDNVYEIINNNGVNYLHVVTSGKYQGYLQAHDNSTFKNIKLANQQFTCSFIGYSPTEGETCSVYIHFRNESGWVLSQVSSEFNLKTYPSKYHFTFKIPNDENIKGINVMFGVGENSIARNVYIGKPKLEFGEIATDWTPSLEDIENTYAKKSEVTKNTNDISSLTSKVNAMNNVSSISTVANMLSAGTSASLGSNYKKTIYNIVVHNIQENTSILFTLFGASINTDESYFDIINPAGSSNLNGMCDVKITMSDGTPSAQLIRVFGFDGTDDTKDYRMSIYGFQIG